MELFNQITAIFTVLSFFVALFLKKDNKFSNHSINFIEKYYRILLIIIFAIGIVVRFYNLELLPAGLHYDEICIAYDTYCLMNYGVDRNLNPYSIYLVSHGSGQNVLLLYLITISFKMFGNYGLYAIRFPTALMGAVTIFTVSLIAKKAFNKSISVIAAFLVAVLPVFIKMSRFGLESYLMYSFLSIATLFFIIAIDKQKNVYYFLAGIFYGLTLYTYAIAYMVVPAILALTILYLLLNKKIRFSNLVSMGIPTFLLALPLMLMLAVNNGMISSSNIPFFIPVMNHYRGAEVHLQSISSVIYGVTRMFTFDDMTYNSHRVFKVMFACSIPLTVIGIAIFTLQILKKVVKKEYTNQMLIFTSLLSSFGVVLLIDYANVNKMNAVYPFFAIVMAVALYELARKSDILFSALLVIYIVNFGVFTADYFSEANYTYIQRHFSSSIENAIVKVEEIKSDAEKVYVCDSMENGKLEYIAFALKSPPQDFYNGEPLNCVGKYTVDLPVYLDAQGTLHEDINDEYVYMVQTDNSSETYAHIRNMLANNGFEKETVDYYDIYYKQ